MENLSPQRDSIIAGKLELDKVLRERIVEHRKKHDHDPNWIEKAVATSKRIERWSTVRMGCTEAVDVFRVWHEEGLVIRWQGSFPKFAFSSFGRVEAVDNRELRLASNDRHSELVIRFDNVLEFDYMDSRQVTGPEKKYRECVIISFSQVAENGTPDTIAIAALDPQK